MGIADLFKPKWKHSNAQIRAAAVKEMSPEETEELMAIAREDGDVAVRRVAVKKITSPEALMEIARQDPDEGLRQFAEERALSGLVSRAMQDDEDAAAGALSLITDDVTLCEIAGNAELAPVRLDAVARITGQKALGEVARRSTEHAVRVAALERVDDAEILRSLCLGELPKELSLAALERIDTEDDLAIVSKKGRIKAVRAKAKRRLAELKEAASGVDKAALAEQKRLHARQIQLCVEAERLTRQKDSAAAWTRFEQVLGEWDQISAKADDDLDARFSRAGEALQARVDARQEAQDDMRRQQKELQDNLERKEGILARLEAAGDRLDDDELEAARRAWEKIGPAPANKRNELERRLRAAGKSPGKTETVRAPEPRPAAEAAPQASVRERMNALVDEAEALLDMDLRPVPALKRYDRIKQRWDAMGEAREQEAATDLEERFEGVQAIFTRRQEEEKERKERRKTDTLTRLEESLDRMAKANEKGDLTAVDRALKSGNSRFRKIGPLPEGVEEGPLRERFEGLRQELAAKREDLRQADEWKRWANVRELEDLCEAVEQLAKIEDLKLVSQALREAQARWKKVGPAPRDRSEALWKRFRAACDPAYERCQEHFKKLDGERQTNLEKKEELCEQVEALADSTDWNETAAKIKDLQKQWKESGPVPRAQSDKIWKRFRGACDKFFDRRGEHLDSMDGERKENLKKKEELCEQVEAVVDSDQWDETAAKIKELQRRWKKAGPVPRAQSDKIWKRFRGACDKFFERREQRDRQEQEENLRASEAVCEELEALVAGEGEVTAEQVLQLHARIAAAGPVPPGGERAVKERFAATWEKVIASRGNIFEGTDLDPAANQAKMERLIQRMDDLAGPEVSTEASAEEIEDQLKSALKANALGDGAVDTEGERKEAEQLKRARAAWRRITLVPTSVSQELLPRFEEVCAKVEERYKLKKEKKPGRQDNSAQQANLEAKEAILRQAEMLAASENPQAHVEAVRQLQRDWKAIGPVPQKKAKPVWNRFRKACGKVLGKKKPKAKKPEAPKPDASASEAPKPEPVAEPPKPEPEPEPEPPTPEPEPEPPTPEPEPDPESE